MSLFKTNSLACHTNVRRPPLKKHKRHAHTFLSPLCPQTILAVNLWPLPLPSVSSLCVMTLTRPLATFQPRSLVSQIMPGRVCSLVNVRIALQRPDVDAAPWRLCPPEDGDNWCCVGVNHHYVLWNEPVVVLGCLTVSGLEEKRRKQASDVHSMAHSMAMCCSSFS